MAPQTVLVVEDEDAIAEAVRARLQSEGYHVVVASDGPEAIRRHAEDRPDLVVLDLMLPGMDGLEVCTRIQRNGWTPVLMLTARTEEADKIAGFAVGADDYLTKPFSLRELIVRVHAILRRRERIEGSAEGEPIERLGLLVDAKRRRVEVDGADVPLTPLEFEILYALAREPGVVLSRDKLMDRIWGIATMRVAEWSIPTWRGCGGRSARTATTRGSSGPSTVSGMRSGKSDGDTAAGQAHVDPREARIDGRDRRRDRARDQLRAHRVRPPELAPDSEAIDALSLARRAATGRLDSIPSGAMVVIRHPDGSTEVRGADLGELPRLRVDVPRWGVVGANASPPFRPPTGAPSRR